MTIPYPTRAAELSAEPRPADAANTHAAALARQCGLTLNPSQQRRLAWLAARTGEPVVWNGTESAPDDARLMIVVKPPTGPEIERFRHGLAPDAVVVIPHGENPAFDALKSCLVGFGTVGADGACGPHQMWWGGYDWDLLVPPADLASPSITPSSTPVSIDFPALRQFPDRRSPHGAAPPVDEVAPPGDAMTAKARLVLAVWQNKERPLLWLDPGGLLMSEPVLPGATACDFAVVKQDRWQFDAKTLYFGRSAAAEALLRTWLDFCRGYPALGESYLLDQAWSLVTSQIGLDTIWLPPSYSAIEGERRGCRPVIAYPPMDAAPVLHTTDLISDPSHLVRLKTARRAERTGTPELLMSAAVSSPTGNRIVTIVRDVQDAGSDRVARMLEAIAIAFESDPGRFSQLEIVLCRWQDDVDEAMAAARNEHIIVASPTDGFAPDAFRRCAAGVPPGARHATRSSGQRSLDTNPPTRTAIKLVKDTA